MRYQALRQIKPLFFSYGEVASVLNIQSQSARVCCSRYVSKGLLVRIKRNIYVIGERWNHMNDYELMQIANIIQVPSYISLTTALSFYNYTTQLQQNFIESVCLNRTYNKVLKGKEFNFTKIADRYYSNFIKQDGIFIALPEKAFIDALYLESFGKYSLDFSSIEMSKLNIDKINKMILQYPERVKKLWKDILKKYATS